MSENPMPLFTIVVPAYNAERYIDECVNSIVRQTYLNLQIILVDDGSTDRTGQLCDEWAERDDRINVLHTKNGGLSAARNAGFGQAAGAWIWFVDSDDYIVEEAVERIIELADDWDLIAIDMQPFDENGKLTLEAIDYTPLHCNGVTSGNELEKLLYQGKRGHYVQSYIYKEDKLRKFCSDTGPFDEDICLLEDVAFIHQYVKTVDKVVWIDEALYCYRLTPGSLVHQGNARRAATGLRTLEIIADLEVSPELEAYRREAFVHFAACIDTLAGDAREARDVRAKERSLLKRAFMGKPDVALSTSCRIKCVLIRTGLFHFVRKAMIRLGLAKAWDQK